MKKVISKKYLIPVVSLSLLITTGVLLACAGGDDFGDFFNSFFAPETSGNETERAFFRSTNQYYGGEPDYENAIHVMDDANREEWYSFFGEKIEKYDLDFIIYNSRLGEIDTCIFNIKDSRFPVSSELREKALTVLSYPDKALAKEFLFYVGFAKRCEPFATYNPGWWSDEEDDPREDAEAMQKLLDGGRKSMAYAKNPFIRAKYAFQITRLLFQKGDYDQCIGFYNDNRSLFPENNTACYRAMGYAAASYLKLGEYDHANYLYSLLFDQCPPMRVTAAKSFQPQYESDWESALAMAQSTREKEVLWHMLGISADPLRAMKEIYALNPHSDLLDLLLMRAVNINEEYFINHQGYWHDEGEGYALATENVDIELRDFAEKVAAEGKAQKIYLWNLAAGYLNIAGGNYQKGEACLKKAEAGSAGDLLVNEQIHALRIVSKIEVYDRPDPVKENDLADEMKWLRDDNRQQGLRVGSIYEWSLSRLSEKYSMWGDSVKAQCLDYRQNNSFYHNQANMEALIAFMDKPAKSAFEKYIIANHPYSRCDLFEYKAIKLIYKYRFEDALKMFDECPSSGDGTLYGDPFIIHINDCHDCDYMAEQDNMYTKYTFIKRLIELQELAKEEPSAAAEYYFLIANGLYNMTFYGNAHQVFSSPLIDCSVGYFWFGYDKPGEFYPFFDCSLAMEYYQKAMNASSDNEFRAQCCFMAAKCEQNQYFSSPEFDYDPPVKSGKYFRELCENYSETDYYKEILNECGYFRMFVEQNR